MRIGPTFAGAALALCLLIAACGSGSTTYRVAPGTYWAFVPSTEQFDIDGATAIPGGFVPLSLQHVSSVAVLVERDSVSVFLDGLQLDTLHIAERKVITDREGSGPFKAKKEVLLLAEDLAIGGLLIPSPAVWPGSFEGSPVITVKAHDPTERGPGVSCGTTELCILLSSGAEPVGEYERVPPPGGQQDSIASIHITKDVLEFTLDDGQTVRAPAGVPAFTRACGLAESPVWDVPEALGLPMVDPVLVHTLCPTNPGDSIQLIIIERAQIPVLAPLGPGSDGEWCENGPTCLWFAPV